MITKEALNNSEMDIKVSLRYYYTKVDMMLRMLVYLVLLFE